VAFRPCAWDFLPGNWRTCRETTGLANSLGRAAAILGTEVRFTRRLVAERRIRFTHVGRYVRIPESALREFIKAGMDEPVTVTTKGRAA
jgi:excisionase family DNA binding protein